MDIRIKRVQDPSGPDDGLRVLVDRLWPRGVRKADAPWDLWLKEVAPSTALRQWFGHAPERWEEFRRRYRAEFADSVALARLADLAQRRERVTLLYSARDTEHNQAQVLSELLRQIGAD